jgi:hypothetical protein
MSWYVVPGTAAAVIQTLAHSHKSQVRHKVEVVCVELSLTFSLGHALGIRASRIAKRLGRCVLYCGAASRQLMERFRMGVVCDATECRHKTCFNDIRYTQAEAAEQQRMKRQQEAVQHSKDALEALRAARRQPLRPMRTEVETAESEQWSCDVGAEGCIKPSVSAPEPEPPYMYSI